MKKRIALLLALALLLGLTACGSTKEDTEPTEEPEQTVQTETEQSEEPAEPETPEEPAEPEAPEFTQVTIGDTVTLAGVDLELTTTGFLSGDQLEEGLSISSHDPNSKYFWLEGTVINVGTETLDTLGLECAVTIVFDDTYSYDGDLMIRNMDGLGPFAESKVFFWADVPPAMLERYQTVKVQFGYNDGFGDYDWQANSERVVTGYTNRYEFVQGDGAAAASNDGAAAEGTDTAAPKTIAIGDTITTETCEFTLTNVEMTYEVMPPNTNGVYMSYAAESGKVYAHVEADVKNIMQRDIRIDELFKTSVLYDGKYAYDGFTVVNNGDNNFDWVGSYVAATPLETCKAHGIVECPAEVDTSGKSVVVTITLDGTPYEYTLR